MNNGTSSSVYQQVQVWANLVVPLALVAGLIYFVAVGCERDPNAWRAQDNSAMAYLMMEEYVEQRLKAPASAEFPGAMDKRNHTQRLADQQYRITSHVDAQNGFGAQIRTGFSGVIEQVDETTWQLVSLEIES